MKPIKLIISGFGPYTETMPAIEFDKFYERGLFLITGDTGAGKTTIFDAICYALYGRTSGEYRFKDGKNLVSDNIKKGVESFIEFHFSHQGKNYCIKRYPSYIGKNKSGKDVEVSEKVIFYYPDRKEPVEGSKFVDGTKSAPGIVHELLHISYEQFKQIAMIAQGEFYDLLNAKTETRTEILRTIFLTEKYKDIEFKLKDKMDNAYKIKHDLETDILRYFEDISADPEGELFEELSELQTKSEATKSVWNVENMLEVIQKIIDSDKNRLKEIDAEFKKAEAELKESNNNLATAQTNNDFIIRLKKLKEEKAELDIRKAEIDKLTELLKKQKSASRIVNPEYVSWVECKNDVADTSVSLETKKSELTAAESEVKAASDNLKEREAEKESAEAYQKKADKISEDQPKYEQRDSLKNKLLKLTLDKENIKTESEKIKTAEQDLKEKIKELKNVISKLDNRPEELAVIKAEEEKLNDLSDSITSLINTSIPERNQKITGVSEKQSVFSKAREEYDEASARRMVAEKQLERSRAGILAKDLKEGQKCPVCGSEHHPEPAKISEDMITEAEYKALQDEEADKLNIKNAALTAAETAKATLDQYEDRLRIDILDCLENQILGINDCSDKSVNELVELLSKAQKEIADKIKDNYKSKIEAEKDCAELIKARDGLEKASGIETDELESSKNALLLKKQNNDNMLTEATATLKTLDNLGYESWEAAVHERDEALNCAKVIFDAIKEATERKEKAEKEEAGLKSAVKILGDSLETKGKEEAKAKKKLDDLLMKQEFASLEEMLEYNVTEEEIAESDEVINKYNLDVSANDVQLKQAEADAKGKTLIDIEELKNACEEQNVRVETIRKSGNLTENRIATNADRQAKIVMQQEALKKALKDYNIYARLYDLVKGSITGKSKISFEQYIQATQFDGIIDAANRRLGPMSDYQYKLARRKDTSGKRSSTFLDLEVHDNFTGKGRPVGNLSGGESFKASLSLALGLSDTVCTNSGGVQMDALFVDEGFGTLDKKSIESALETLVSLSGANKLVGIISHREELKDIPQKILVKKMKDGSRIEVESV